MKLLKATLFTAVIAAIAVHSQASTIDFDFTAAEGFVDGGLDGQNGIAAQSPPVVATGYVVDTSGTGTISAGTTGFLRFLIEPDLIDLSLLPIGESVTLELLGYSQDRGANANLPIGVFGLSFVDAGNVIGGSGVNIGLQLRLNDIDGDGEGTDIVLDGRGFADDGINVDTGFDLTESFDVTTVIERTGADSFQATSTAGNSGPVVTETVAGVTDLLVGIIYQGQGFTAGTVTIDGVRADLSAIIPEPASICLVGFGMAGLLFRRR